MALASGGLKVAKKVAEALAKKLKVAKPDEVIRYDDELIEQLPSDLRKQIADHNTVAMGDEGQAYRDSFTPSFHSTNRDFNEFSLDRFGEGTDSGWFGKGVYTSPDAEYVENFATGEGQRIMPLMVRPGNAFDWRANYGRGTSQMDAKYSADMTSALKADGFDSVEVGRDDIRLGENEQLSDEAFNSIWKGMGLSEPPAWLKNERVANTLRKGMSKDRFIEQYGDDVAALLPTVRKTQERVSFNPKDIRSKFAAFDPAKADSPNLMAQIAGMAPVAGLGALATTQSQDADAGVVNFLRTTGDQLIDSGLSRVENMSPQDYLKRAFEATDGRLGGSYDSWMSSNRHDPTIAEGYANQMVSGDQFPMPYIDNRSGSQDGRNRAIAAQLAGEDSMPVGIIDPSSNEQRKAEIIGELKGAKGYKKFKLEDELSRLSVAGGAALGGLALSPEQALASPYSAGEYLAAGNMAMQPQAVPARFPALHKVANLIGGYQDPTGMAFDTTGMADYLRQFGEEGMLGQKMGAAFGAQPF